MMCVDHAQLHEFVFVWNKTYVTCNCVTWNKIPHIFLHKLNCRSPYFDMLVLVTWLFPWLQSTNTRARQSFNCLWLSVCVYVRSPLIKCSMAAVLTAAACLVNRSANTAFCALLVFLVMGTSMWWTFFLCCSENCNFSPFPPLSFSSPSLP